MIPRTPPSTLFPYTTLFRSDAATGIITTVAGNGTAGFGGDDGPATAAQLTDPSGIALDASGNLFIADRLRVRRVDRKSTRLNSSHTVISYAVFCLKKKKLQP